MSITGNGDSLRRLVAASLDSISSLRARIDSLSAPRPDATVELASQSEPHAVPWLGGAEAPLLGALLAVLGGFGAQWFRAFLEERRTREQLVRRIRNTLEAVAATARSTLKKDEGRAINPEIMRGIIIEWGRYDRISDDLRLLGKPGIEERIDNVLGFARKIAEKVIEDEERFRETRRDIGTKTPSGIQVDANVEKRIKEQRKELLKLVGRMRDHSEAVLVEFNDRWPAESWHKAASLPDGSVEPSGETVTRAPVAGNDG